MLFCLKSLKILLLPFHLSQFQSAHFPLQLPYPLLIIRGSTLFLPFRTAAGIPRLVQIILISNQRIIRWERPDNQLCRDRSMLTLPQNRSTHPYLPRSSTRLHKYRSSAPTYRTRIRKRLHISDKNARTLNLEPHLLIFPFSSATAATTVTISEPFALICTFSSSAHNNNFEGRRAGQTL